MLSGRRQCCKCPHRRRQWTIDASKERKQSRAEPWVGQGGMGHQHCSSILSIFSTILDTSLQSPQLVYQHSLGPSHPPIMPAPPSKGKGKAALPTPKSDEMVHSSDEDDDSVVSSDHSDTRSDADSEDLEAITPRKNKTGNAVASGSGSKRGESFP
jgi:hypothetical protein